MSDNQYREKFEELLEIPAVAHFVYYFVIVVSGWYFIRILIPEEGINFGRAIPLIMVWLILILLLQPPKGAQVEVEPFEYVDILDDDFPAKQV